MQPMFYVLWRTWSHWRALKSSQYLKAVISQGQLHTEPSKILDELYAKAGERGQEKLTDPASSLPDGPKILLTSEMVEELSKKFGLEDQARASLSYGHGSQPAD